MLDCCPPPSPPHHLHRVTLGGGGGGEVSCWIVAPLPPLPITCTESPWDKMVVVVMMVMKSVAGLYPPPPPPHHLHRVTLGGGGGGEVSCWIVAPLPPLPITCTESPWDKMVVVVMMVMKSVAGLYPSPPPPPPITCTGSHWEVVVVVKSVVGLLLPCLPSPSPAQSHLGTRWWWW